MNKIIKQTEKYFFSGNLKIFPFYQNNSKYIYPFALHQYWHFFAYLGIKQ